MTELAFRPVVETAFVMFMSAVLLLIPMPEGIMFGTADPVVVAVAICTCVYVCEQIGITPSLSA